MFVQSMATYTIHLTPEWREFQENWDKLAKDIYR